ncbi:transglutaminase family protein [Nereida sp. MMG025]|uniref:transglutaminase-like domain-containing protein n=1 Tax=Nereida sp. MMG025 TaxID=2909981 RepID=UPI001F2D8471|nr:transglutaminase family protein [Nereida sp. MMG025]MCF6445196.1 transglutaminase family protein [Nereida sp. MMG025]
MSRDPLLKETALLDYSDAHIQALIAQRGWRDLAPGDRAQAAYQFVKDEITFGYNRDDNLPASAVLLDGYGQCNTKTTLLMALFRALDIKCQFHGFTIHKSLQRGIVPELVYPLAPNDILHSWVEAYVEDEWLTLEGFILDAPVLSALKAAYPDSQSLCAYGVGTEALHADATEWTGGDTFIQKTGINQDFGTFPSPDAFYAVHRQLRGLKGVLYRSFVRHWMNARVRRIRQGIVPDIPETSFTDATLCHPDQKEAL